MRYFARSIQFTMVVATLAMPASAQLPDWNVVMDFEDTRDEATDPGELVQGDCDAFLDVYEFTSDAAATIYNDVPWEVYGDGQSLKSTVQQGSSGFGSFGGILNLPACGMERLSEGDEVWIRFRMKFPPDFAYPNGRLKWVRLRTRDAATGDSEGYLDMYLNNPDFPVGSERPFHLIAEFDGHWDYLGEATDLHRLDRWETYEIYYRLNSQSNNLAPGTGGVARIWKNGLLLAEVTDRKTLNESDSFIASIYLFTWFTNNGSPQTQSVFLDDLRITNVTPGDVDAHGNPYIGMEPLTMLFSDGFELGNTSAWSHTR
ncbi:MAG: hypothetical protein MPN21_13480 [Thermoanaerobaculia bacterium]|nr:hypothetical protein [Thermoanaerobaculia bacterium]